MFHLQMYLTVHSYGQYFLYPWGYEQLDAHDRRDLHNLGMVGARAIKAINSRRRYKVGSAAKMLYPASGKSWLFAPTCIYFTEQFKHRDCLENNDIFVHCRWEWWLGKRRSGDQIFIYCWASRHRILRIFITIKSHWEGWKRNSRRIHCNATTAAP